MYWWGASSEAVKRGRRVLGVGRTDNEGTVRLMRAAAEKGAAELRGKELPAEEVERRRQTALELDLAQHLQKGYHGPWWTAKDLALLRKLPDDEVAARVGRTTEAVRSQRQLLGIPNPESNRWSPAEDGLVRALSAMEAAARTGRSLNAVYGRRRELGLSDGRAGNGRRGRRAGPWLTGTGRPVRTTLTSESLPEPRRSTLWHGGGGP
jgi:hypothetical protein